MYMYIYIRIYIYRCCARTPTVYNAAVFLRSTITPASRVLNSHISLKGAGCLSCVHQQYHYMVACFSQISPEMFQCDMNDVKPDSFGFFSWARKLYREKRVKLSKSETNNMPMTMTMTDLLNPVYK